MKQQTHIPGLPAVYFLHNTNMFYHVWTMILGTLDYFTIYLILEDFIMHNFCLTPDICPVHPEDGHRRDRNM